MNLATQSDQHDRITGTLLGLAAGDRIGGPLQFALRLAESLLETLHHDRDEVFRRYLAWYREGAFDTGPVAERVLSLAQSGIPVDAAVLRVDRELAGMTAGCNPAHRAAPIAMALLIPDAAMAETARREASLTHRHPLAGDAAAAVAVLCRALIRGAFWETALDRAMDGRMPAVRSALDITERGTLESQAASRRTPSRRRFTASTAQGLSTTRCLPAFASPAWPIMRRCSSAQLVGRAGVPGRLHLATFSTAWTGAVSNGLLSHS